MYRRSIAVATAAFALLLFAFGVAAQADTPEIVEPQNQTAADGWQAGTCSKDGAGPGEQCDPTTATRFFKQAGGHPPEGFTQSIIQHENVPFELPSPPAPAPGIIVGLKPLKDPEANRLIKTQRVDLPPGLTVNPEATPKCSLEDFRHEVEVAPGTFKHVPACAKASEVGRSLVTLVTNVPNVPLPTPFGVIPFPKGAVIPPSEASGTNVSVFDLEPEPGEPALFGFFIAGEEEVLLKTEVSWESDFHESFTIASPDPAPPFSTLASRLLNFGESGNGTYITTPTTCFDPEAPEFAHLYSTWFRADSFAEPNATFPAGSTPVESVIPAGAKSEGCDAIPFDPSISVNPGTNSIDSPAAATVTTELPFEAPGEGGGDVSQSQLRSAVVKMPAGMGLNPSGSKGLLACTDAQFAKGERVMNNDCPAASEIGSAEIVTPVLSAPLKGDVYVGEQKSSDPTSGEEFRVLVEAKDEDLGIVTRLVGNVAADPKTGQLTATLDEQEKGPLAGLLPKGLPQVPFESVKLQFNGAKTVLSSPPTCAASKTTSTMEPWSTPAATATPDDEFTLTTDPGGGTCPQKLEQRRFAPAYTAVSDNMQGGSFSPFRVHIGRADGEQELKQVDALLPKGLTGKLAGIPYCPEAAIAAAANRAGKAEQANPSCPAASQVGTTTTASGTGPDPVQLPGKVYLAGPYKGAPISLAVVTPAVQGPFDLGTVVVRVALKVDPITAQIHALSDVIPDVFGGVKLDLRSIDFNMDRNQFTVNPTNCAPSATTGSLAGGGADPTNPAAFSAYAFNVPYQPANCGSLGFKPSLKVKLFGPTTRAHFPRLQATLQARPGDANISRTALTLPHALFLEQGHIGTVCTNPKLAAHECPADSVYGQAEAVSPLLDQPLKGSVYLVPSGHELPDLVADLQGQVEVQLHGTVSSKHGGLRTVFESVPDVPVSKFVLSMRGGKKSLLVNSTNTCKHKQRAVLAIDAQNGKSVVNNKFPLSIVSCAKRKRAHKHHHKHGHHHR
jgi:hypothetical protein